jgi:hypothetical protein
VFVLLPPPPTAGQYVLEYGGSAFIEGTPLVNEVKTTLTFP